MLDEVIRRRFEDEEWVYTRGAVIQRVFAHDIYHCAGLNEALSRRATAVRSLGLGRTFRRGERG